MEYRKKNLKPKANIAEDMKSALANQDFMEIADFYQQVRKNGLLV
jgi:cytochrome c553